MLPSLYNNEWVIVSKYEHWFQSLINYNRGDIVYFYHPKHNHRFIPINFSNFGNKLLLTKRIIALEKERIHIVKGQVYIDDHLLEEPYLEILGNFSMPETQVPKKHFFVIGDNRLPLGSIDSRHFGPIAKTNILGRVWSLP